MSDVHEGAGPHRRRLGGTLVPLVLITGALVALVALPVIQGRQLQGGQDYLDNVIDPALQLIQDVRFYQSRQFASVQGFVLTQDPDHREQYRRFDDRLEQVHSDLAAVLEPTPPEVRAKLAELEPTTTLWTFNHLRVLNEELTEEEAGAEFIAADRALYEDALRVTDELRQLVSQERQRAVDDLETIRGRQIPITAGLVGLSLLATLSVGVVGRRMGGLMREVETRRSEAVRARRQTEAVMAATADGVVGIGLDGRITSINQAGCQLLDYSRREALGKDVHDLMLHTAPDGQALARSESAVVRGLSTGEAVNLHESILWRRDGTSFPVQLQLRPLIDGRDVRGAVLTFTDVTEQREIAEALRQALRARDEVLAVVSHDLRNPVGTVFSAADLLLEVELPPDRTREHLSIIKRSAAHMNRLIQDLLDVARMEAGGGLSVDAVPSDVVPLLEEACALAKPRADRKNVHLACQPDDDLPPALADSVRIRQVLSNLIGNAIKFTPSGGRVVVGAKRSGDEIVVGVADTGPGIPREDRPHVFDRFWQVKRSDRSGAGLGLAIVKGIVEAHDGTVKVESEEGEGSVFYFTLPVAPPES